MRRFVLAVLLIAIGGNAEAQSCPAGIPGANNPSCLPPSVEGSPYYVGPQDVPLPAPQPTGEWHNAWGAVFVDFSGAGVGAVVGRRTEDEARSAAEARCRDAGGSKCERLVVYKNQCMAVAWPTLGGHVGTGGSPTESAASKLAIEACQGVGKGCQILYSACSLPTFHRY